MGLHEKIKAACAEAAPIVASAAKGTESGIYHLNQHVADLCALLCKRLPGFDDALARRGVRVTVDRPEGPQKHA